MTLELVLEREFLKRKGRNASYSLRAYAKDLGVDYSSLSRILNGQRKPSQKFAKNVITKLSLETHEFQELLGHTEKISIVHQKDFRPLALDEFMAISDWYYDAILELTQLKDFQDNPLWISEKINLDYKTADLALKRLKRLGWLSLSEDGKWVDLSVNNTILADHQTTQYQKKYQKQILEKSIESIDETCEKKRSHTSNMVAVDSSKVDEAKKLIHQFRRDLASLLSSEPEKLDSIYQVQIGLFPLTKEEDINI